MLNWEIPDYPDEQQASWGLGEKREIMQKDLPQT